MFIQTIIINEMKNSIRPNEKKVISLYFDYGYIEREIAEMLSISQQRVSQIKGRALERMRKAVK